MGEISTKMRPNPSAKCVSKLLTLKLIFPSISSRQGVYRVIQITAEYFLPIRSKNSNQNETKSISKICIKIIHIKANFPLHSSRQGVYRVIQIISKYFLPVRDKNFNQDETESLHKTCNETLGMIVDFSLRQQKTGGLQGDSNHN